MWHGPCVTCVECNPEVSIVIQVVVWWLWITGMDPKVDNWRTGSYHCCTTPFLGNKWSPNGHISQACSILFLEFFGAPNYPSSYHVRSHTNLHPITSLFAPATWRFWATGRKWPPQVFLGQRMVLDGRYWSVKGSGYTFDESMMNLGILDSNSFKTKVSTGCQICRFYIYPYIVNSVRQNGILIDCLVQYHLITTLSQKKVVHSAALNLAGFKMIWFMISGLQPCSSIWWDCKYHHAYKLRNFRFIL